MSTVSPLVTLFDIAAGRGLDLDSAGWALAFGTAGSATTCFRRDDDMGGNFGGIHINALFLSNRFNSHGGLVSGIGIRQFIESRSVRIDNFANNKIDDDGGNKDGPKRRVSKTWKDSD